MDLIKIRPEQEAPSVDSKAQQILRVIDQIRPTLPIQNPMPSFVHNNPIQYWEQMPFAKGLKDAVLLYENVGFGATHSQRRELEDLAIPIVSTYLDQGLNRWGIQRPESLWRWFIEYLESTSKLKGGLVARLKKSHLELLKNETSIETLERLLSSHLQNPQNWHGYIRGLLFHLKGWSGMVQVLENRKTAFPLEVRSVSLVDWTAILVTCAIELRIGVSSIRSLNTETRARLLETEIQRISQGEQYFYRQFLQKMAPHLHNKQAIKADRDLKPLAQIVFCIDDREEPLRRHLEAVNPAYETFGTVGFFGVDFQLRHADELIFRNQCPPVVTPQKAAVEVREHASDETRPWTAYFNNPRFTIAEPFLSLLAPPIYFSALLTRTLLPRTYDAIKAKYKLAASPRTKVHYHFESDRKYSIEEKADIVMKILHSAGMGPSFSRLVVIMGHTATTTNNPFERAYGCGACSGHSGMANARIFCDFANDLQVRDQLIAMGYYIPPETRFVSALHDTCSDEFQLDDNDLNHDQDHIPTINQLKQDLARALDRTRAERFRIFRLSPETNAGVRALDWSQPRPEFGHSRVALSVFGPRSLTRHFDLERRAFLISYDPTKDPTGSSLEFVLNSSLPVCANINLDYFTSGAFPSAFGSGSKLPMNVAAGLGLMTGSKSDLRIGLARQMVDRHEPMRLLSLVFCTKPHLDQVLANSPRIRNLVENEWIHLIRIDPATYALEAISKEISGAIPPSSYWV